MIERESHEDRVLAAFMVLVIAGAIAWTVFISAPFLACGAIAR
jgi:hypothetical protein